MPIVAVLLHNSSSSNVEISLGCGGGRSGAFGVATTQTGRPPRARFVSKICVP
jgi:hypothetical protein